MKPVKVPAGYSVSESENSGSKIYVVIRSDGSTLGQFSTPDEAANAACAEEQRNASARRLIADKLPDWRRDREKSDPPTPEE